MALQSIADKTWTRVVSVPIEVLHESGRVITIRVCDDGTVLLPWLEEGSWAIRAREPGTYQLGASSISAVRDRQEDEGEA